MDLITDADRATTKKPLTTQGFWLDLQLCAKVPPQIAQQKQLSGSVYGEREEDMKIDSKEFTQQRDENSLWNNKKPKNQNFLRHNQYRAPQK